jgi:hypothetical protein
MIPVKKLLGYGGGATIDGTAVLMTSGSFEESVSIPYLEMISTPPDTSMAGRVKHADGTTGYTGSISFDVTATAMSVFSIGKLLKRNYSFAVNINDGVDSWKMSDCKVTSLTINGGVGGIVASQISFMSASAKGIGDAASFQRGAVPLGYWYTGVSGLNLKSWTLMMSQNCEFVYKNISSGDPESPGYIKTGIVSYSLNVDSYAPVTTNTIKIGTGVFTLTGNMSGKGYAFGGITDLGTYSYTFETGSPNGASNSAVIT